LEKGHTWRPLPGHVYGPEPFFLYGESFTRPPTTFCYQHHEDEPVVWNQRLQPASKLPIITRKCSYFSKDGTEIGMTLIGSEVAFQSGEQPLIMTAYGGFGLTTTPQFSAFVTVLLGLGFLFSVPEIRGGGERGRSWHEAARGRKRQVAFDDFIAAADWLCRESFTTPRQLAIFGGSNSGILVGAAITQRPDLFRAAVCVAPLLDMVRYHHFDRAHVWANEYGTAEDPDDFRALLGYSPYHRVQDETNYPAVLFVCGDRDTRCNPAHSLKMTARLQEREAQQYPILLDHSEERGHAPTMPLSVRVESLTRRIAFLCRELRVPWTEGGIC
jgi:prolyl oligopeptidase